MYPGLEGPDTGEGQEHQTKADEEQDAGECADVVTTTRPGPSYHANARETAPRTAAMPPMRSDMPNPFRW